MKEDRRFRTNTSRTICKVYPTLASIADGFQSRRRDRENGVPGIVAARYNSARLQNRETQKIADNSVRAAFRPTLFI
jgi:hypothetical protein